MRCAQTTARGATTKCLVLVLLAINRNEQLDLGSEFLSGYYVALTSYCVDDRGTMLTLHFIQIRDTRVLICASNEEPCARITADQDYTIYTCSLSVCTKDEECHAA